MKRLPLFLAVSILLFYSFQLSAQRVKTPMPKFAGGFLMYRLYGANAYDFSTLYGSYADPEYTVEDEVIRQPDWMVGGGLYFLKYFNSFQPNAETEVLYTGSELAKLGEDTPDGNNFHMVESISSVGFRQFLSGRNSVMLFLRYRFLHSRGEYQDMLTDESYNSHSQDQQTSSALGNGADYSSLRNFEFYQYGAGLRIGYHNVADLGSFKTNFQPTYTYYPAFANEQIFKLNGDGFSDRNSASYDLHFAELLVAVFTGNLLGPVAVVGVNFRYFYQVNQPYGNESREKIQHKENFGYFSIMPCIEVQTRIM
jgi:hypothetical protein